MHKIKYIIVSILLLAGISLRANGSSPAFTGLEPSGNLPECFTKLSTEKYKEAKEAIDSDDSYFEKKSKKNFYLKSNFVIDRLLLSGKVVYGDPVTEYLNEVADYLLKDKPELRKRIRFFTTKSQYTNAFATDQGIIFMNTGLFARVHSEAELAFVMAHEISHIYKEHVISMHIEKEKMIRSKGKYRGISIDDNFLNYNMMSKEQESEADELAYTEFYKKTNYCLDELDSAFVTLLYAQMPIIEAPFDISYFETKFYKFPESYRTADLDTITKEMLEKIDIDVEDKSTHPATVNRRKAMGRLKIKENNQGRKKYIVSEEKFNECQRLCRLESVRQMMLDREYLDAIFNCNALLKIYPDDIFLDQALSAALYIYSRYRNKNDHYDIDDKYSSTSTEIGQLRYFLRKLNEEEISILALKQALETQTKHGSNFYFDTITSQLYNDVFNLNGIKKKELFSAEELTADTTLNNPDKPENELYFLNAFAHLLDNEEVRKNIAYYDNIRSERENKKELSEKAQRKLDKQKRKKERITNRKEELYGKRLGVKNIAVIDPFYFKFNEKKNDKLRLIESERKQLRFSNRIQDCAAISDLSVNMVNPKEFSSSKSEEFKHMAIMKEWLSECLEHENKLGIIPFSSLYIESAIDYFGTENIMWTGVLSERESKDVGGAILTSVSMSYGLTLPAVLLWAMIPAYETFYFAMLFDVRTGENKLTISNSLRTSDFSGDFVNAATYDAFFQINKQNNK